ncbi:MAG: AAA family ATPase, partial [Halobacteriaceae archaeon]
MSDPAAFYETIQDEVGRVLVGKTEIVERLTIAALTRGHVLLEGVPGVAKTTIATLFARASGLEVTRIQMTPDILPADITGTHVYREQTGEFTLQRGPVFANVVIADEINRATPKTQSALLEAMQERSVTIEGETLALPNPFMVVATQNPIEMEGVFTLPEAQRDRFQLKLLAGLPSREEEAELLDRFDAEPDLGPGTVEPVVDADTLAAARATVADVHVADAIDEYILDVVAATRDHDAVDYGASPRASLAFLSAGKAHAAIRGRAYVIPDDIKALAHPVLAHRLVLGTDAELTDRSASDVVDEVMGSVPV